MSVSSEVATLWQGYLRIPFGNSSKDLIEPRPYSSQSQESWKERFLGKILLTLIKDDRPYGYSQVMTRSDKSQPWVGNNMTDDGPTHEHPMDIVNYLVATKCEEDLVKSDETPTDSEDSNDAYFRRKYGPANVIMKRHEVTLVKGIVPPGALYNKAIRSKQLIPPRYQKFFNESSCFLPDSVAIELLNNQCQFCPKEVIIRVPEFGTFLENAEHERADLSYLADFLKDVESLSIVGEVEKNRKSRVVQGAKSRISSGGIMSRRVLKSRKVAKIKVKEEGLIYIEDVPSRVLELILANRSPKLTSLSISVSRSVDDVTESITPILTSSYKGLTEFHVRESGRVSPDIIKLISITEYHPMLHTISISINEITQCFGSFGPVVKNTPQISYELLQSWIQICFAKPSLHHLKLSLSPASDEVLLKILIAFLSTSCSHDQTLTFSYINLKEDETKSSTNKKKDAISLTESSTGEPSPDSALSSHQFGEASTLLYKSLIFDHCSFKSSFTNSVFSLQPLKLKQFVVDDYHLMGSSVLSRFFQQPGFDVQSFKISSMSMSTTTFEDYTTLLQKESLMSVTFVHCSSIDPLTIRNAAKLGGFHLEEKSELVYKREQFIYTLRK